MALVLDAGALIAADRGDRDLMALIKRERMANRSPRTHGGVVGQVWRSARQANLARILAAVDVQPLDEVLGRRAGVLLGRAGTSDVIDAALVLLAADGDDIHTPDTADLRPLAETAGLHIELIPV